MSRVDSNDYNKKEGQQRTILRQTIHSNTLDPHKIKKDPKITSKTKQIKVKVELFPSHPSIHETMKIYVILC